MPQGCAYVGHGPGSKVHIQKSKVAALFIRTDNCFTFAFDDKRMVTGLLESIKQDLSKIVICSYKKQTFCHATYSVSWQGTGIKRNGGAIFTKMPIYLFSQLDFQRFLCYQ